MVSERQQRVGKLSNSVPTPSIALQQAAWDDISGTGPCLYTHPTAGVACLKGKAAFAIELVSRGADVNARDDDGLTALIAAIAHPEVVKMLLAAGARAPARLPRWCHLRAPASHCWSVHASRTRARPCPAGTGTGRVVSPETCV